VRVLGITPGHHRSDHARAGEARRWRATGRWSRRGSVRPRWPEKSCRPGVPAWPGKPAPTAKPSHPQASPACRNTGFRQSTVPAKRLKPAGATTPRRTPHARAIQARAAWLQTAVAVQALKADQPSERRGGHLRPTDRRELARPRTRRPRTLHNGHPARTRPRTPPSTATRPPTPPTPRAIPNTNPPTSPRRNPTTRTKPTEHAHKAANPEHSTTATQPEHGPTRHPRAAAKAGRSSARRGGRVGEAGTAATRSGSRAAPRSTPPGWSAVTAGAAPPGAWPASTSPAPTRRWWPATRSPTPACRRASTGSRPGCTRSRRSPGRAERPSRTADHRPDKHFRLGRHGERRRIPRPPKPPEQTRPAAHPRPRAPSRGLAVSRSGTSQAGV
jgi:hypothetical protein